MFLFHFNLFRSIEGLCNNLDNPHWGAAMNAHHRQPYWILVYSVQAAILDSSLQCTGGHIGFLFTVCSILKCCTVYRRPYWILVYCVHLIILDFSLQCTGCHIGFQFTVYRLPYWILVYMYRWLYWILVYSVYRRPYWILVYSVQAAILDSCLQCTGSHIGFQFTVYRRPYWAQIYNVQAGSYIVVQFTVYRQPYLIVVYTVQVAILESNLQNLQVSMLRFSALYTVQCTVQKQPCWILV